MDEFSPDWLAEYLCTDEGKREHALIEAQIMQDGRWFIPGVQDQDLERLRLAIQSDLT